MHSFASFVVGLDILCGPVPLLSHLDTIQFLVCDPFLSFVSLHHQYFGQGFCYSILFYF